MQAAEPAIQKKGDTAVRAGVAGAPTIKDAPTGCSNAVCGIIVEIKSTGTGKKATHSLTVDVGESTPIKVVSTVAMDAGTRIVVALAGSSSDSRLASSDASATRDAAHSPARSAPSITLEKAPTETDGTLTRRAPLKDG